MSANGAPLAIVVKGWPRLSETFIAQELAALEAKGFQFEIWSLRFPTDEKRHPLHDQIDANIRYLPEYLHHEPGRVLKGWRNARVLPGYEIAFKAFVADLRRDVSRNRIRRFGQACVMATEMPPQTKGLYAHFLHTPASVARYCAMMRGVPWGFSAHAKDIWTSPDWELLEKLSNQTGSAQFGVTCTRFGAQHLQKLAANPQKIDLVYHGLDLSRFPEPPERDHVSVNTSLHLLSVGRLVQKKGFDRLIDALALLPPTLEWKWEHIGGGGLKNQLQEQARIAGVTDRVIWRGACDQPEVIDAMRRADLFVLPSRVADNGDRDGLPNVLMEAAGQKLPILSTNVSAIPEFIETGVSGVLIDDDPAALASCIIDLAADPEKRRSMAEEAFRTLKSDFGMQDGIKRLSERLQKMCHDACIQP